jgi:uncharacterized phage-associated protein
MSFPFDSNKATEVACRFARLESGRINVLKLVKLVYLLDRLSIQRRNIPVVGGAYFSMKNGPVTSEVLDLINADRIAGTESVWPNYISSRRNHEVEINEIPTGFLSESEVDLLEEIYREHGTKDQWQLRDWCHRHCAEWTPLIAGHCSITPFVIAKALGKSEEQVREVVADADESAFVEAAII